MSRSTTGSTTTDNNPIDTPEERPTGAQWTQRFAEWLSQVDDVAPGPDIVGYAGPRPESVVETDTELLSALVKYGIRDMREFDPVHDKETFDAHPTVLKTWYFAKLPTSALSTEWPFRSQYEDFLSDKSNVEKICKRMVQNQHSRLQKAYDYDQEPFIECLQSWFRYKGINRNSFATYKSAHCAVQWWIFCQPGDISPTHKRNLRRLGNRLFVLQLLKVSAHFIYHLISNCG
jgi:hypothetical protein